MTDFLYTLTAVIIVGVGLLFVFALLRDVVRWNRSQFVRLAKQREQYRQDYQQRGKW